VDEVDIQPVDLGDEVRDGVQPRLALAPVVLGRPVASEVLHHRERHALRVILDGLPLGKAGRADARPQVLKLRLGDLDREWSDRGVARRPFGHDCHVGYPPRGGRWCGHGTKPERLVDSSRLSSPGVCYRGLPTGSARGCQDTRRSTGLGYHDAGMRATVKRQTKADTDTGHVTRLVRAREPVAPIHTAPRNSGPR
jgi:hypothetical protein